MQLEFGILLKKRRRRLDLTQEDLAERALCSVNSLRKIESGDLTPSRALAQALDPRDMRGAPAKVIQRLNQEHDNARSALRYMVTTGRAVQALALSDAWSNYGYYRHYMNETIRWLPQVLAMDAGTGAAQVRERARICTVLADFLRMSGDYTQAGPLLRETIADWQQVGEEGKPHLGFALLVYSRLVLWQGDLVGAETAAREGVEIFQALADLHGEASALRRLGEWALCAGQYPFARKCLNRAYTLQKGTDNLFGQAVSLLERGDIARAEGDLKRAYADYAASERVNETGHDEFITLRLKHRFGILAALEGHIQQARELLADADHLTCEQGAGAPLVLVYAAQGYCAAREGNADQARQYLDKLGQGLESMNMVLMGPEALEYERTLELPGVK